MSVFLLLLLNLGRTFLVEDCAQEILTSGKCRLASLRQELHKTLLTGRASKRRPEYYQEHMMPFFNPNEPSPSIWTAGERGTSNYQIRVT